MMMKIIKKRLNPFTTACCHRCCLVYANLPVHTQPNTEYDTVC